MPIAPPSTDEEGNVPGPQGPQGPPGTNGTNGADGAATLGELTDVYDGVDGGSVGDQLQWDGALWIPVTPPLPTRPVFTYSSIDVSTPEDVPTVVEWTNDNLGDRATYDVDWALHPDKVAFPFRAPFADALGHMFEIELGVTYPPGADVLVEADVEGDGAGGGAIQTTLVNTGSDDLFALLKIPFHQVGSGDAFEVRLTQTGGDSGVSLWYKITEL